MTTHAGRRRGQRGSVLMVMPAAVLIVLLLGAIAVDSAVVYLRQRQAYDVAAAAANDAAGAGFDLARAQSTGEIVYDPATVEALAAATVRAAGIDEVVLVSATPDGTGVVVTVDVTVQHLFVQAFGDASRDTVRISARADGVRAGP